MVKNTNFGQKCGPKCGQTIFDSAKRTSNNDPRYMKSTVSFRAKSPQRRAKSAKPKKTLPFLTGKDDCNLARYTTQRTDIGKCYRGGRLRGIIVEKSPFGKMYLENLTFKKFYREFSKKEFNIHLE